MTKLEKSIHYRKGIWKNINTSEKLFQWWFIVDPQNKNRITSILKWSGVYRRSWFHFFQNCQIFQKHFLSTFIRIQRKPKQTICTPKRWLNVSTALGHMLMPSARRWADNRCCGGFPTRSHPNSQRHLVISGDAGFEHTVWDCGYLCYNVLHNTHTFVYMAIYDLEIN